MSRRTIASLTLVLALAVAGALLAAAPAVAGGGCHTPRLVSAATETIGMDEGCFKTTVAQVRPGTKVTWVNDSFADHTVSGLGGWGSDLPAGARTSMTFDEAGVFPYFCHYHPGMIGAIVVSEEPVGKVNAGAGPSLPRIADDAVEDVADDAEEIAEEADDALEAPLATASASMPLTGGIAVGSAALGLVAGLVLRGRRRLG